MQIQKNSRQVPKKRDIMQNKNYCDLVYAWFQCKSYRDNEEADARRHVKFSEVNYTNIGKELDIDRKTVGKYVKYLIEMNLLEMDDDNKVYYLVNLDKSVASLIPLKTLRELVHTLNRNTINIFIYLLNRYLGSGEKSFSVSHSELKDKLGLSTKSSSNNLIVKDILNILMRLGLISYETKQEGYKKSTIIIRSVSNVLPATPYEDVDENI